jgi:lysophospholipid acyltransferase (LPLAT)-like uncharacterized protein
MKFRHPLAIRALAFVCAQVARVWISTLRPRMYAKDGRRHPVDPREDRYIYAFWHDGLLAPLTVHSHPIQVLISQHADGELIAQTCQRLGVDVIRGSSGKGGCQALLEMIRHSDQAAHLVITPDGPRGPRHELKPGILMVASHSGLPIVPVGIAFSSAWRARSWDRFAVPRPFSRMVGVVGQPIALPPPPLDRRQIEDLGQRVNAELARLTLEAEALAAHPDQPLGAAPTIQLPPANDTARETALRRVA